MNHRIDAMDAIVSGADDVALCVTEARDFRLIRSDQVSEISAIDYQLWRRQLKDSPVHLVWGLSEREIIDILREDWARDRTVRLALISVDPTEDASLRIEAKEALNDLLANARIRQWFIEHDPRR
jgi:hypothetical protein